MLTYKNKQFYLNDKKFNIYSGAVHYFRVFPEQWEDRLYKLKCAGLNTVETYCAWNIHEQVEGRYNFEGIADIEKFIKTAQNLGLYVIIRPGPFICAEWEFGGLPAWLLKDENIRLRTLDDAYFKKASEYMKVLMSHITPYLETRGGNVIMMAVENEYGSFGNSHKYMDACADLLRECGVDVPLFTADGHMFSALDGGRAKDAMMAVDFGYDNDSALSHFDCVQELQPDAPLFHVEHWIGMFAHWDERFCGYPAKTVEHEVRDRLKNNINFNLYVFHGGTNWGFMGGANSHPYDSEDRTKCHFYPTVTSYDYDAPLTEWGECTPKFFGIQKAMEEHLGVKLPKPEKVPLQNIGTVKLTKTASLFENLSNIGNHFESNVPRNMEYYGQNYGYILYRKEIIGGQKINLLAFNEVNDRVHVFFNGIYHGTVYRNDSKQYLEVDGWMDNGGTLDLLVDNLGHVNFGPKMLRGDRKGICDGVYISMKNGPRQSLFDFDVYTLPMDNLSKLDFDGGKCPAFFMGYFDSPEKKDCFIHLDNFTKGFVVVNGFNLGRFWNVGPQLSLYLPYPLLKDKNQIIVFEETECTCPEITIDDKHVLGMENDK